MDETNRVTEDHVGKNLIVTLRNLTELEIKVLAISHKDKFVRFKYPYSGNFDLIRRRDITVIDTIDGIEE